MTVLLHLFKDSYQWFVICNHTYFSNGETSPICVVCQVSPSQWYCIWFLYWIEFCLPMLWGTVLYCLVLHQVGNSCLHLPAVVLFLSQNKMHPLLNSGFFVVKLHICIFLDKSFGFAVWLIICLVPCSSLFSLICLLSGLHISPLGRSSCFAYA